MRRRDFILLFGSAAAALPSTLRAQEASRTYRVGGISASSLSQPYWVALFDELRRAGFVEGQNLIVDWHPYSSHVELIPAFAAELVKSKPDVIVAVGDAAIRAAQNVTKTIPILGSTDDMVASGLVSSLARPEGNTTGTSIFATELDGKRQELLLEVVPGLHHIATLADSRTTSASRLSSLKEAADARNVELSIHSIAKPEEISAALEQAQASGAAAVNVLSSSLLYVNRGIIIQKVAALRLITGDWFDNCSCAVACPCTFAQAPDNGVCESVLFWHIRRGHYGDIKLDDLSFVRVGRWEGDLWAGKAKGTAGIFIDERADERQAEVLPRIFGGQVGGFPALVGALFAEGRQVRGIERARITFEIAPDRSHWGIEIAGKVKAWAKALTGPTSVANKYPQLINAPGSETGPGQIVTWGKSTNCSVDAFGYKFQWTTNSSKHIPFDWSGP